MGGGGLRLAGGTIAYKTSLMKTIAQSSTEGEYMEATDFGKMTLFVRSVMWDLGIPQCAATVLYEDNDAATAMANAQKPTPRTRHMDIRFKVLAEWVERDLVQLARVDTKLNLADHFTKQLGPLLFRRHVDYLLGHVPPQYSSQYQRMRRMLDKTKAEPNHTVRTPITPKPRRYAAAAAKMSANWNMVTAHFRAHMLYVVT